MKRKILLEKIFFGEIRFYPDSSAPHVMKKMLSLRGKFNAAIFLLSLMAMMAAFSSCKKEHSCYDEKLFQENQNKGCTLDCPGVIGCDGKTYCNECEANRQGIRLQ